MKKKLLALAMAACMALSMTAFADETEGETASAPLEVQTVTPGKLTVATSPDFAPYEFYAIDEDGNPTLAGFDIELAKYIADYMGLELEIIPIDFNGVLTELATKSVDIGMSGLSPDPDRMDAMDFSDIYRGGGQSLVTVKDKADTFNTFEAVNKPEVSVGAQIGSIQETLAKENSPEASLVSLVNVTDIISELLAGKLDAAYIETAVAESYQKNYPELEIVLDVPYDIEGTAAGVCKGNTELLMAVNEAIALAKEDGTIDKLYEEAEALAAGEKYEGMLDDEGEVPEEAESEAATEAVTE